MVSGLVILSPKSGNDKQPSIIWHSPLVEIILGLINAFNLGNGLLYWSLGFGVLHIVYGAVMWFKYERKK
jgi:hypothetical protein